MDDDNDDLRVPSPLEAGAAEGVCPNTVAGWLYYCDEHDTHGNADSEEEVEYMADAHKEYFRDLVGEEGDPCVVQVWFRTPHERTAGK